MTNDEKKISIFQLMEGLDYWTLSSIKLRALLQLNQLLYSLPPPENGEKLIDYHKRMKKDYQDKATLSLTKAIWQANNKNDSRLNRNS